MSKGTPIVGVRMPAELRKRIEDFVQRNRDIDKEGDLTLSKFVVKAVLERFAKLDRSKKCAAAKRDKTHDQRRETETLPRTVSPENP